MKRWALLTVGLYVLALLLLTGPVIWLSFFTQADAQAVEGCYCWCWLWIVPLALCQAGLLVIPVRLAGGRPVARRHVLWTVLTTGVLLLLLAGAATLAVGETVVNSQVDDWVRWSSCLTVAALWILWGFVWFFYTGGREPQNVMQRIVRFLIVGSILELLVAVPTHVLARTRGYCCAGFGTFWGLAAGISIMLLAFGPSVFWLFLRRYRAIKPPLV
jgi:hypothetical protein